MRAAARKRDNVPMPRTGATFVFLNQRGISRACSCERCEELRVGLSASRVMPAVARRTLLRRSGPLCYSVGDITALQEAMAAAVTNSPSPHLLRAQISKYDVSTSSHRSDKWLMQCDDLI